MNKSPDTIVVVRSPGETRYALIADERVVELAFVRDGAARNGAYVVGRVTGRGGPLLFVDIGDAAPGVLKAKAPVPEGQAVAVEIVVPSRGDKGAELIRAGNTEVPDGAAVGTVLKAAPDPAQIWWQRYRASLKRIVCAPAAEQRRVTALLKDAPVVAADGRGDPFETYGVNEAIEAALSRRVALVCGGALTIETTAAAVMIDIDSGPAAPPVANGEAMDEIARALRLRNIAGHILVDVIPQGGGKDAREAARRWGEQLGLAVLADPVQTQIAGATPLGMIELTRRRLGLSVPDMLNGVENIAYEALRKAVNIAFAGKAAHVQIVAPPPVIALLQGRLRPALVEAAEQTKGDIALVAGDADRCDVKAL